MRYAMILLAAITVYGRPKKEPYKHNPHVNLIGETKHTETEHTWGPGYVVRLLPDESLMDETTVTRVMTEYVGAAEALLAVLGKANPSGREVERARLRLWTASQRVDYMPESTFRYTNLIDNE